MGKRVTITDISRAAGVSTATVSYYLNGRYDNMSEEVQHRLASIIKEMGYRPNNLARGLKSKDSKTIGLIMPGLYGQIAFRVVAGACNTLDAAGYTVNIMISNEDIRKEREYVESCIANQVNGIIIIPAMTNGETNLSYLKSIHESGTPIVLTTRCPEDWPFDGVRLNYARSVDDMVAHLHRQGYGNVALFLDADKSDHMPFTKALRRKVFLESMHHHYGIDATDLVWCGIRSEQAAEQAMQEYLTRYPETPKAVFAVNSPTLGYALQATRKCGLSMPKELGLAGYGGWDWTYYTDPPLTTLTQPLDKVGETAAELMLGRLQNAATASRYVLLNSSLIPCESTNLLGEPISR